MYYSLFDNCSPFPQSSGMALLSFAASVGIVMAIDKLLRRRETPESSRTIPDTNVGWLLARCEHLEQRLAEKEHHYRELRLVAAASQAKFLQMERRFLANEEQYERRYTELQAENSHLKMQLECQRRDLRTQPFILFAEKILLANKVWQQRKDLSRVQGLLADRAKEIRSYAFATFRDRLLAANLVWRQQLQMKRLKEEAEKMKQGRVRAVARSAKQMVLDTRKEGLIEEMVNGLIEDIEEGKRREKQLKDTYERKLEEMNRDWLIDSQRLVSEIEGLKLSQQAHLIEQEISNDMEGRLSAHLEESRREVRRLALSKC